MEGSHTPAPADEAADHDRLRLVPTTTLGLAERLAGRLDRHLVRFAEHLREGLLAASVAVGLEVMGELMDAEVTDLAGPRASTTPLGPPSATAARMAASPSAAGGCRSAGPGSASSATTSTSCPWRPTTASPRPTCSPTEWSPAC
jgi:hypothetical protein